MTAIKVLDRAIFNRIAAGEVVERPRSIVKELIENAIDAGASEITVEARGGGVEYIRVTDNGCGIHSSEVKIAFLPHATSKIGKIEDLDGISTLGFRGEALPSIASVAKVTMLTRASGNELGTIYIIDNGVEVDFGEMGAPCGTSVTVENLFERIPARKKFLGKITTEESAISGLVAKYILANHQIAFTYILNGKTIHETAGSGVENAIKTVYGDEFLSNLVKVHSTMSDIVLDGFINKPAYSKHSKAFQTLIVNGRYVIDDEISYTIFGCYQKYLMKRQYPAYVLYLNLPYDLVDVNVHPNKLEVKFAVPGMIKKLVADAVKEGVIAAAGVPKDLAHSWGDEMSLPKVTEYGRISTVAKPSVDPFGESITVKEFSPDKASERGERAVSGQSGELYPFDSLKPSEKMTSEALGEIISRKSVESASVDRLCESPETALDANLSSFMQSTMDIPESFHIVGKLFNTYIIVERGEWAFFIDQHAAHEKLLYDRLYKECMSGQIVTQNMLIPYEFTVSPEESEILSANLDKMESSGFVVTHASRPGSFLLKSVPLCCIKINAKQFITDFLKDGAADERMISENFRESLMQSACKAATKGEDDLSQSEVESLLEQMAKETSELFCPHGRPIALRVHRREIEKWFKRIV